MRTATGDPQTIVLFGGTSEIGLAIVTELITLTTRHIVLACRNTAAGDAAAATLDVPVGCDVHVVTWDATAIDTHPAIVDRITADIGDLDIVIIAAGVLGRQDDLDTDPISAGKLIVANTAGPISTGTAAAGIMRHQRHGHLVVLSSVAGIRARAANYTYGASKAGLDAWARGLADRLRDSGVNITIVRPGFVDGRMTAGHRAAPFASTPDRVAIDVVTAIGKRHSVVHTPGILRWLFLALRHLPNRLWRLIPG